MIVPRIMQRVVQRVVPLTLGFIASAVVSMALAASITALDITGVMSVVVAVTSWCAVMWAAATLYARGPTQPRAMPGQVPRR